MKKMMMAMTLTAGLLTTGLGQAAFIDGYQDRRGFLAGASIGGAYGNTSFDSGAGTNSVGFMGSARLGGGVRKNLTLDLDSSYWFGSDDTPVGDVDQWELDFLVNPSVFLGGGLYLRGGMGFAIGHFDDGVVSDEQTGLAVGAGIGYEFFMDSDVAFQAGFGWRSHFYDGFDTSLIGLQVGVVIY